MGLDVHTWAVGVAWFTTLSPSGKTWRSTSCHGLKSPQCGHDEPVVGFRQEKHVGDLPGQALEFLGVRGKDVPVFPWRPVLTERYLRLRHQVVNGRTQLMGQVRRKFGQTIELFLQSAEHFVESGSKVCHLYRKLLSGHPLV